MGKIRGTLTDQHINCKMQAKMKTKPSLNTFVRFVFPNFAPILLTDQICFVPCLF